MEFSYLALHCHECGEDKEIDRRDSCIQNVINNIHLVDPLLVDSRIPKELHHYAELGQLGDLAEQDQADVEPEGHLIDFEITTHSQILLDIPESSHQ